MTNSPPKKKNLEIQTSVLHTFWFHFEEKKKVLIQKKGHSFHFSFMQITLRINKST